MRAHERAKRWVRRLRVRACCRNLAERWRRSRDARGGGVFAIGAVTVNSFFLPPDELSAKVQFGFILRAYRGQAGAAIRRLPTGKATIYYAADIRNSSGRLAAGLFCEGPSAKTWDLENECGEVIAFKVRAGALGTFLGGAAREVRGRTISLDAVWGREAFLLLDAMASAGSCKERRDLLAQELIRRVRAASSSDADARLIARGIERAQGRTPIAVVAARAGFSQRLLLKKFDEAVGLTPKQYARIARLRATLVQLAGARGELARLALECGFCDQAHLIHEFQDLLGCAPAEFIEQRHRYGPAGAPSHGSRALPRCERRLYPWLGQVSSWVSP
jgi:AraC-like DNA-binding protein